MPTELRRKDVKSLVQQGRVQLIEVLPEEEYGREHLPHAINVPLDQLTVENSGRLRRDIPIIVYGADYQCDLSARAAWRLEGMGYLEVYRYTAGKADWLAAGFPTEGSESKKPRLKDILKTNVMTCLPKDRLGSIKNRRPNLSAICVVVNDRRMVLGLIQGKSWDGDPLKMASEIMELAPRTFRPNRDQEEVMQDMKKADLENALVTTSDGELLGFVQRREKKVQKNHKAA